MMLGDPVALITQLVGQAGQFNGISQSVRGRRSNRHRRLIQDRNFHAVILTRTNESFGRVEISPLFDSNYFVAGLLSTVFSVTPITVPFLPFYRRFRRALQRRGTLLDVGSTVPSRHPLR